MEDNGSKNVDEPSAWEAGLFDNLPGRLSEERGMADAKAFTEKYGLPCATMLARLLIGTYRNPPDRKGPEARDSRPVDAAVLAACKKHFDEARESLREMQCLLGGKVRLAFPHILATDDVEMITLISVAAVNILHFGRTRETPVGAPAVFLRDAIDLFSRYILLVTNAGPVFSGKGDARTPHRQMLSAFLHVTGWDFADDDVDRICAINQLNLHGKKAGSCGLHVSRDERADVQAWRLAHGIG